MSKVTCAVVPVAGYGTRFLPATKATPKEMLQELLDNNTKFCELMQEISEESENQIQRGIPSICSGSTSGGCAISF